MSWLTSLFEGDPTATAASKSLINTGSVATGAGLGDVNDASKFYRGIMGGDTSVIAPQISAIQKQGSQALQTASQFGNRSGGTNATVQMSQDSTRASINDLIAQLTGTGASTLATLGTNLLNTGTRSTAQGADISMQNKSIVNQLLQSVGGAVGGAATKWALNKWG